MRRCYGRRALGKRRASARVPHLICECAAEERRGVGLANHVLMLKRTLSRLVVATSVLVVACAGSHHATYAIIKNPATWPGRDALGCWRFVDPPSNIASRLPGQMLLELTDQLARIQPDSLAPTWLAVRAVPGVDTARARRLSGWAVDSADASRIDAWLGNGFSGVRLSGRLRGDSVRGRAREYVDFWPSLSWSHAFLAVRSVCPP